MQPPFLHPVNHTPFLDYINATHPDLDLTEDDLKTLYRDQWRSRQQYAHRLHNAESIIVSDIQSKLGVGTLIKGALSVGAILATGGSAAPFIAAASFAGIVATDLMAGNPSTKPIKERSQETRGTFESGGELGAARFTIPVVYGNRFINPDGGVRLGGIIINCRIQTFRGATVLYVLYLLSLGEGQNVGYGEIASVDEDKTLFNGQPRNNFTSDEIVIDTRLGGWNQGGYPTFTTLSQIVNPRDYANFGIDLKTETTSGVTATAAPTSSFTGVSVNGRVLKKLSTGSVGWNAGAFSNEPGTNDIWISARTLDSFSEQGFGFSHQDTGFNANAIQFGWSFLAGAALVTELGAVQANTGVFSKFDQFDVTYDNLNGVQYWRNGVLVYTSAATPTFPLYADVGFRDPDGGFRISSSQEPNGLVATTETTSTFTVDDPDRIQPAQQYRIVSGTTVRKFRPDSKNYGTNSITVVGNLAGVPSGSEIYGYNQARYQTTKHVGGKRGGVYFNLGFFLSARGREDNELKYHGTLFDLFMRDVPATVGWLRVGRFHCKSKNPQTIYRAIFVRNLALGNYKFKFDPQILNDGTQPIYTLTDEGQFTEFNCYDGAVAGKMPIVKIEGRLLNVSLDIDFPDEQAEFSSESQPTGRIISIDEIVDPVAIGLPDATRYRGLTTQANIFQYSDRISGAPEATQFIDAARVVPNLLAAGEASNLSTTSLVDLPANFVADGILPGMFIRNLSSGQQAQIATVGSNTITTTTPLAWAYKDRYLAFFEGSTCYFPDVMADMARNPWGGIPTWINPDIYLDYPRLVKARKFCVANRYFWDWHISEPVVFLDWIEEQAKLSRLFVTRMDGRYGLLPDEIQPLKQVFTIADIDGYKEDRPNTKKRVNQVVLTMRDGREKFDQDNTKDRFKTITVETLACYNGTEPVVTETIDAPSITRQGQGIQAASLHLASLQRQDREVSFSTFMSGFYIEPGDLIAVVHPEVEYGSQVSGWVEEVQGNLHRISCGKRVMATGTSDGTNIIYADPGQDFVRAGITFDDVVFSNGVPYYPIQIQPGFIELGSIVPPNAPILTPIPSGQAWELVNLSAATMQWAGTDIGTGLTYSGAGAQSLVTLGGIWYNLPGAVFKPGDRIIIAPKIDLWRVRDFDFDCAGDSFGKTRIAATKWDAALYDTSQFVKWVDDTVWSVGTVVTGT